MSENDINRILNAIGELGENIQETNKRMDKLDMRIEAVNTNLSARIEEVNTNLSARIDKLDMRIEEVNKNLSARIDKLDMRIEEVNTNLSEQIKEVNTRVDNLESSVNKRFDAVNARIDAHHRTKCGGGNGTRKSKLEPRVKALEERTDAAKAITEYQEERINNLEIQKII